MDASHETLASTLLALLLLPAALAWTAGAALLLSNDPQAPAPGGPVLPQRVRRATLALAAGVAQWTALFGVAAVLAGVPVADLGAGAVLLGLVVAVAVGVVLALPATAGAALAPLAVAGQALVALLPGFALGRDWPPPTVGAAVAAALIAGQAALRLVPAWRFGARPSAALALRAGLVGAAWFTPLLVLAGLVPAAVPAVKDPDLAIVAPVFGLLFVALAGAGLWLEAAARGGPRRVWRAKPADAAPRRDTLTQLAERDAVGRWVASDPRASGPFAMLVVGFDGFKKVNDAYGQRAGDAVLAEAARRIAAEADAVRAPVVARSSGDEFTVVLPGETDRARVLALAERVIARLAAPLAVDGHDVSVAASAGVAFTPEDGDAPRLHAYAEAALRAAKQEGGARVMAFEARFVDDAREKLDLLRDLRRAIDERQLELHYQPRIDARSGQITAAEALLRWHHPSRGMISPAVFVPLAERYGLIGALGNWVIEDACRQAYQWRKAGLKMRVAINLSAVQMREDDLVDRLMAAVNRYGIDPARLTCEITESLAMEDTATTQRTFARLGEAGIHVSIDDFGTGYSSLAYLRRLPAEELKIDRAFVKDLGDSEDARAIVDAVIKMAHALGLRVVAEGVETLRQRDVLLGLGCDELQGFLFARPMTASALLRKAIEDPTGGEAFRPSLFADTATPTVMHPSVGSRRTTRPFA